MKREIALIGFGRFGQFVAKHLAKQFAISVFDSSRSALKGIPFSTLSLDKAAQKKIILLAVPINKLQSILKKMSPHLTPGTLVCDLCSVKEQPIRWMKELLPNHVSILGLHPLFGPDSASKTVRGRVMVVCPVRIPSQKLQRIKKYFRSEGLIVHQTTPLRHDKMMALTLFLTQFLGHTLNRISLPNTPLTTKNFDLLLEIVRTTGNDTQELFRDMHRYNRFAKAIPSTVINECRKTAHILSSK